MPLPYKGNHEGPLEYTTCDIPHAVTLLPTLLQKGRDVYCGLPLMTTFMGHKKVMGTEHYLRLTQKMYPELIRRTNPLPPALVQSYHELYLQTMMEKYEDFAYALQSFFQDYLAKECGVSGNTIRSYRDTFVRFLDYMQSVRKTRPEGLP